MYYKNIFLLIFLSSLLLILIISCNRVDIVQLLNAVMENEYEVVEKYIKQGGNINIDYEKFSSYTESEWNGMDLLTITIVKKHRDIFKLLIKAGIDVNKEIIEGYTPIMIAVNNEDIIFVKELINADADLDKKSNDGYTALLIAVERGYNDIVELLLQNKCDPNITDLDGLSPLMIAVYIEDINLTKLLITYSANVNQQMKKSNISVMQLAVQKQNIDIVKILLEAGADPNVKNKQGLTPKIIAQTNELTEIVKIIEKYNK